MARIYFLVLLLGCWGHCQASLILSKFNQKIRDICYPPVERVDEEVFATSVQTLIALVEKLESHIQNPEMLIDTILDRFSIEGLALNKDRQFTTKMWTRWATERKRLLDCILNEKEHNYTERFDENWLENVEEKCTLHRLLSHSFNASTSSAVELGVAGVQAWAEPSQAVDLSRTLIGILAGLRSNGVRPTIEKVYQCYDHTSQIADDIPKYQQVHPVFIATMAEFLGTELYDQVKRTTETEDMNAYVKGGLWDSRECPRNYTLESFDQNQLHIGTFAQLRGATDGLILGLNTKSLFQDWGMKLSDVLRMYYEGVDVMSPQDGYPLSYCYRREWADSSREWTNGIGAQIEVYAHLLRALGRGGDDFSPRTGSEVWGNFLTRHSETLYTDRILEDPICIRRKQTNSVSNPEVDVVNDVIFVLDSKWNKDFQARVINAVVSNLTTARPQSTRDYRDARDAKFLNLVGSAFSVFTNSDKSGQDLRKISGPSSNKGCPACAAWKFLTETGSSRALPAHTTIELLENTVSKLKEQTEKSATIPGKSVVLFNFDRQGNSREIKNALSDYFEEHHDVPIYLVGPQKSLESYLDFQGSAVIDTSSYSLPDDSQKAAAAVLERMAITSPISMQFPNCDGRGEGTESSYRHEGAISKGHLQYWVMHPNYFHRSTKKIRFEGTVNGSGEVEFCYQRSYTWDIKERNKCDNLPVTVSNPCKGVPMHRCRPFYFTVRSLSESKNCSAPICRNARQVSFTISHENVRCSNSWVLVSSALLVLSSAIFSMARS